MPSISSLFPSDYLKASDLQGRAITVTMSHISTQDLNGDPKPILYFQGKEKGLVLNKTKANKISEMFGDDYSNWSGGQIILYEAMVEFQGKTVPAIRVRLAPRGVPAKAPITPPSESSAGFNEPPNDDIPF
jgi:hypothetical protein